MSIKFFDMFSGIGGFEDARGTLFFEIARIAEVKRPKEILNKALKSLSKKQRRRIILHYSGMTEREIAKIEKVDQKTIHE